MHRFVFPAVSVLAMSLAFACASARAQDQGAAAKTIRGWLSWRGPQQDGTTLEKDLPREVSFETPGSWQYDLRGRGTPVIADGRVFVIGYEGEDETIQEVLVCLDEKTGKKIWEHRYSDFLSDIIYSRYSIGAPTVDPETGNVYFLTTPGLLLCFTRDGKLLWQHSLGEAYGRLTFPNGRTGAVLIDGPRAIIHIITSGWGKQAPARDRFFAFDKKSGEPIWSCTPGGPPKDSSFSFPVIADVDGRRLLYAGLGGGHVACVDARTGEPVWRFQMSIGGVNSNPLMIRRGDGGAFDILSIHGKENLDSSTIGRMVRIKPPALADLPAKLPLALDKSSEVWRNDLVAFTSSPTLVGRRAYQTTLTGELNCVDVDTGKVLWHKKLAPSQIHASPSWGDGKLYVPMNNGTFHIVVPGDTDCEVLQTIQLEGACVAAPSIANGRIYVHTTEKLYCFAGGRGKAPMHPFTPEKKSDKDVARIQIVPGDICVRQGDNVQYKVRGLDAHGRVVVEDVGGVSWSGFPTAGVEVSAAMGEMAVAADAPPTAATIKASANGMSATARLRIVPLENFVDDFESVALPPEAEALPIHMARPYWVSSTKKWEVRDREGNKVLAKTLSNPLFQRTLTTFGNPKADNYTMTADVLTDGNRRIKSTGGVVNQRYLIILKGNYQAIEISSNMERIKQSVKFKIRPKVWYRLKTRVDIQPDGSGIIRAKAWPRDEGEPKSWTIEVKDPYPHTHGAPGIYGFVPQSRFRVYLDNISVTSND